MSKRSLEFYIVDILKASFLIGFYTDTFQSGDELLNNHLHWDATIREFEILGEATKKLIQLGFFDDDLHRMVVDFRNKIAHEYFGIDEEIVFNLIQEELPLNE